MTESAMRWIEAPRRAWVLNLDAENELEVEGAYSPSRRIEAIVRAQSARLVGDLVRPTDVVLTEAALARDPEVAAGLVGVAWSPTPRAMRLLERAGARVDEAPRVDVLRRVNAREFAAAVRSSLEAPGFEKTVAGTLDEALAAVARPAELGWLVRRPFGAAGRGRRRLYAGRPAPDELAWLEASLRIGPVVVEPWVRVTREYTRSGWVHRDGRVALSGPCLQETTEDGAWSRTTLAEAGDVKGEDDDRLAQAFEAAGRALHAAGYFGPFGIDAFRHRRLDGSAGDELNPMSEINARFTMDWALATGTR